jgi:glucose-1-phosphatase
MPTPRFLYFDLGMVIVTFSVERMCRQIAAVSGLDAKRVPEVLFDSGLQARYEHGQVTTRQFYEEFCQRSATTPAYDALLNAACDIFELHTPMVAVLGQLHQAGCRLGVLSNTCEAHWQHCLRRFRFLGELFHVYALSYQIRAAKPEPAIFHAAAELAGVAPNEMFFTDDLAGHIAGARAVGVDAVQFTSAPQIVSELFQRGVRFNY